MAQTKCRVCEIRVATGIFVDSNRKVTLRKVTIVCDPCGRELEARRRRKELRVVD